MPPEEIVKLPPAQRCSVCGKFISWADIDLGKAQIKFTADTQFTEEEHIPYCKDHNHDV